MSDLLPLVIVALRDRALADTQQELDDLHQRLEIATSIEIIRDVTNTKTNNEEEEEEEEEDDDAESEDATVYASGKFEDGHYRHTYRNDTLWIVPLNSETNENGPTCKLAGLRECQVCFGGGFGIQAFSDTSRGYFLEINGKVECSVYFDRFGKRSALGIIFFIDGWPKEEWEPLLFRNDRGPGLEPGGALAYLEEIVATNHPEAKIRFKLVLFNAKTIRRPLKRLLP